MAEGDPGPVGVGAVLGEAEVADHGQRLGGEGLVDLEHVDVVDLEVGLLQHRADRRDRPMPMYLGSTPAWA